MSCSLAFIASHVIKKLHRRTHLHSGIPCHIPIELRYTKSILENFIMLFLSYRAPNRFRSSQFRYFCSHPLSYYTFLLRHLYGLSDGYHLRSTADYRFRSLNLAIAPVRLTQFLRNEQASAMTSSVRQLAYQQQLRRLLRGCWQSD